MRVEVVCDREEALKPMVKDGNDGGASASKSAMGQSGAIAALALAAAAAASSSSLPLPATLLAQGTAGVGAGAGGGVGAHTPDAHSQLLSPALALLASGPGLPSTSPGPPRPEPVSGCVPLDGEVITQSPMSILLISPFYVIHIYPPSYIHMQYLSIYNTHNPSLPPYVTTRICIF